MHPLLLCVVFSSMNSSTSSAIVWSASIPCKLMTVMTSWWQRVASMWYSFFCSKTNKVIKRKLKKKKIFFKKRVTCNAFLNLLKLPTTSCWSQQVFQTQLGCGVCKWLWQGTDLAGQWKTTDRRVISFSHEIPRSELPVSCSYTYKY